VTSSNNNWTILCSTGAPTHMRTHTHLFNGHFPGERTFCIGTDGAGNTINNTNVFIFSLIPIHYVPLAAAWVQQHFAPTKLECWPTGPPVWWMSKVCRCFQVNVLVGCLLFWGWLVQNFVVTLPFLTLIGVISHSTSDPFIHILTWDRTAFSTQQSQLSEYAT